MRWIWAGVAALLLAWVAYLASPYWAAARFTAAVAGGDVEAVARQVNLRAIRVSVVKQLAAEGVAAADVEDAISSREAQMAAAAALAIGAPLAQQYVSARGVLDLFREIAVPDLSEASRGRSLVERAASFGLTTRWRGFRNIYVSLPPGRPTADQVRLQFRLSRFAWRLVSVDLPASVRQRLARSVERVSGRIPVAPDAASAAP